MDQEGQDESLLSRFNRGDVDALGELAQRYETALVGLARGLLGRREELARDAVQDAWVKVIKHGAGFDGRSSVRTWLYRIVINRCRDVRRAREQAVGSNGTVSAVQSGRVDSVTVDALSAAVEGLSESARLIVLLCYHRGLTHPQAAEVLAIPLGTLKSRLHTALEELRTAMGGEGTS